jgi:acetyl esterase
MPVLPALQSLFQAFTAAPPRRDVPVAEARAIMHAMIETSFGAFSPKLAALPCERDYRVPVTGGEITVRIYASRAADSPRSCHMNIHGGGFWLGTLEQADGNCRALATQADCIVASVDYRLAPEYKFPTAAEDCYAALLWVVDHVDDLGIDASRISVGGGSAGGNLAAVVALMARDRRGPPLVLQVLEIPVTDFTNVEPLVVPEEGLVIPSGKEQYRDYYLATQSDAENPYASPLVAPDLSGLPPALVMCAEYDPLRPEGEAYAKRLVDAGVSVECRCWKGQFHGSQQMASLIPEEAAAYRAQVVHALLHAHGRQ